MKQLYSGHPARLDPAWLYNFRPAAGRRSAGPYSGTVTIEGTWSGVAGPCSHILLGGGRMPCRCRLTVAHVTPPQPSMPQALRRAPYPRHGGCEWVAAACPPATMRRTTLEIPAGVVVCPRRIGPCLLLLAGMHALRRLVDLCSIDPRLRALCCRSGAEPAWKYIHTRHQLLHPHLCNKHFLEFGPTQSTHQGRARWNLAQRRWPPQRGCTSGTVTKATPNRLVVGMLTCWLAAQPDHPDRVNMPIWIG